jgi:endonuclease G
MKSPICKAFPRSLLAPLFTASALLATLVPAGAIIDTNLQMQLGNPSGATTDPGNTNNYLIVRAVEAIGYNATLGQPNWASWDLTANDANNAVSRSTKYFTDTNLPSGIYRVTDSDYSNSGWSRGHMCPSGDRTDSREDNDTVFLMSNMVPQNGNMNSGVWDQFENDCRTLADAGNQLLITAGPSRFTGLYIASNHVAVPGYNWKIVVVVPSLNTNALDYIDYSTRVIAINITNSDTVAAMRWTNFVTTVNDLQDQTGFTFFTALPPNLAAVLRSKVDGQAPPAPAISGFSPTDGAVGTIVTVTGTNLNFTTIHSVISNAV